MNTPATTISSITLVGTASVPGLRRLKIALSNGENISVAGSYGGYEQYGSTYEWYAAAQPIAQRYTKWLNGGSIPKRLKYTTIEQTHPELETKVEDAEPIISLTCCCCGDNTKGRQWNNRDTGYGICPKCVTWIAGRETAEEMQKLYGTAGFHHSL
jgi:hypothetical protein